MTLKPAGRRTTVGTVGDHDRRITKLERDPMLWEDVGAGGGGGDGEDGVGIQFGQENDGNWLHIHTNTNGSPDGYGIEILADEAIGVTAGLGIQFIADSNSITFEAPDFLFTGAPSSADFVVNVGGGIILNGMNASLGFQTSPPGVVLTATAGPISLSADENISLQANNDRMELEALGPITLDSGQHESAAIHLTALGPYVYSTFSIMPESVGVSGDTLFPQRGFLFEMAPAAKFVISHTDYSSSRGENPIFVVDFASESAPTYHIKTGATWVADL